MSARRCSICNVDWRNHAAFAYCPKCGEQTWHDPYADPTPEEMMSIEEFEANKQALGKYENNIQKSVKPPSPSDLRAKNHSSEWIDASCHAFRAWLDTVTADDFKDFPSSRA